MNGGSTPTHGKLRFLKVLLPGFSKKLEIPPEFAKHIASEKSEGFNLWSPLKKPFHVKVLGKIPNLYFGDGWPEFVHDHELDVGYFLIFCYEGPKHFSVHILDRSSCEKDYSYRLEVNTAGCRKDAGSTLQEIFRHKTGNSKFKESKKAAKHLPYNVDLEIKKKNAVSCHEEEPKGFVSDESEGVIGKGEYTVTKLSHKKVLEKSKDSKVNSEDQECGTTIEGNSKKSSNRKRIRRECVKNAGNDFKKRNIRADASEFSTGSSYQEKHATYKVTLKPNNLEGHYYLYVPVDFKEAVGLSHKNKLLLRDPNGKLWQVDIQHSTKNRTLLVRGWKEFCVTNMLKPGDDCEFYLTSKSINGEKILQVSITRHSEEYRKAALKVQRTCGTIVSGIPWFWIKVAFNSLFKKQLIQIPNAFTAKFDISQKQHVILKDKKDQLFSTGLFHSTRKRTFLGREWTKYATANRLKPGDVCEFRPDPNFRINSTFYMNVLRKSCAREVK